MSFKHYPIKDIIAAIEEIAPSNYQETYDNAGLIIGSFTQQITKALICIDVTEAVVDEAIDKGAELIIAHHPIIFKGLKRLNGSNYVERTVIKAIQNNIAIYAAHTNLDNVISGVNQKIAEKLQLKNLEILAPIPNDLTKLVTFIPQEHLDNVRNAIFESGAGHIGKYDRCAYTTAGTGSFRASQHAEPFVGSIGETHFEAEIRFETVFPNHLTNKVIRALKQVHPYQEVAYDLYPIKNTNPQTGAGVIGVLDNPITEIELLLLIKQQFNAPTIRHTELLNRKIKKIALCGGSGSFLLKKAIQAGADLFISGDFKYHEFFDAEDKILIADIGHYESEQFTKDVILEILTEKIPNFATCLSETTTNPVKYL